MKLLRKTLLTLVALSTISTVNAQLNPTTTSGGSIGLTNSLTTQPDWNKVGIGVDGSDLIRKLHLRDYSIPPSGDLGWFDYLESTTAIRLDAVNTTMCEGCQGIYTPLPWDIANFEGRFDLYNVSTDEIEFSILQNGYIGMGTTSPSTRLEVSGALKLSGGIVQGWTSSHWNERIYLPLGGAIVTDTRASGNDRHLGFGMTNSGWYFITGDDNLGESNYTPKYAMFVNTNGKMTVREVEVNQNNWPDYVFEEDYQLRSLGELSEFVNSNKHLPEVPSAGEIENGSLNLGEMDAILLKKIEELTLYILQQQKEIDELKAAVTKKQ